jgi:hypothetical protein
VAHSHHTQGWRVLESASVSYGKATPYFPMAAVALGAAYTLSGRVADAMTLLTQAMELTTATETRGLQALCRLSLRRARPRRAGTGTRP